MQLSSGSHQRTNKDDDQVEEQDEEAALQMLPDAVLQVFPEHI